MRDDILKWKSADALTNRPPIMILETYVEMKDLSNNQSMVVYDDQGTRWDVEEALNTSPDSSSGGNGETKKPELTLERWQIKLGRPMLDIPNDLGIILPRIYKNSIVLFRALYVYSKLLPAWKISKRVKSRSSSNLPKIRYRIFDASKWETPREADPLSQPLFPGQGPVVENYAFDPIDSPAGPFSIHVTYRQHCDLRIEDSEALLSSQFMGMDDQDFQPSLGRDYDTNQQAKDHANRKAEVGSLPPKRRDLVEYANQGQAYGSMSTFHQLGAPLGTSPLSALRAARDLVTDSPTDNSNTQSPPPRRSAQTSRSSLKSADGAPIVGRRPSVSFMPFKTPSLSASPQADQMSLSSKRASIGKAPLLGALTEAQPTSALSSRNSLSPQPSPEPNSPKPRPASRYSSSFSHRRSRLSVGGGSRTSDENNSSGKASLTSSKDQPGSLADAGGGSSGSIPTDDDNISDFLSLLDQKKDLRSFRAPTDNKATAEASTRRTTAALNKYHKMRDSNTALSESMTSSLLLQRSSSSSSRQLSSVPPMVAATSISTSSSPGKPISPHTPHTPAIPSRLSANSIIEYPHRPQAQEPTVEERRAHEEDDRHEMSRNPSTVAIDIPTSPRTFQPSYRRSSSVAQQHRALPLDEDFGDIFPFGQRSTSLGADERPPLSLSALIGLHDTHTVTLPSAGQQEQDFGPLPQTECINAAPMAHQPSAIVEGPEETGSVPSRPLSYRPRPVRGAGRGLTPPQGSVSSLERASGSGSSDHRGGRHSYRGTSNTGEDDEPLLFAMSDFGAVHQSRRSLEEARAGSSAGTSERGGGESRTGSRRGSRKGPY